VSRAPRVLVAGSVLGQPMGGVRRHTAELLPRLARLLEARGGALAILEGREPVAFELPSSIERIASDVPASPPIARWLAESRALRNALTRARERGAGFDLVHTAHFPAPRDLGLPYTLTIHDLRALDRVGSTSWIRRVLALRVVRRAARNARAVFTVTATVAQQLAQHTQVQARVIGNGVDHFVPLPRTPTPSIGAPLVHLGHIEPRKNLELLLRALAHDASLPDLELWGASKHREEERLRAVASQLAVDRRVHFRGAFDEDDLPRLLATCAAVVLPSRLEGFGIPALEAQRAQVPLAVSRAGALLEVAGETTPSFSPDDPAECARAIRTALSADRATLERAARRANEFTWDRAADKWFEGFCDCV